MKKNTSYNIGRVGNEVEFPIEGNIKNWGGACTVTSHLDSKKLLEKKHMTI